MKIQNYDDFMAQVDKIIEAEIDRDREMRQWKQ